MMDRASISRRALLGVSALALIAAACDDDESKTTQGDVVTTPSGLQYEDIKVGDGAQPQAGQTVIVHYTGTLGDGTVFDSSTGSEPLEFVLGEGNVIPGFEQAVRGMNPGDTKTTTIPAAEAYGPHEPTAVFDVPRAQLPPDVDPQVGQQLGLQHPSGQMIPAVIAGITDENVTIDANHPLAGEDLTFEIQLVGVGEG